MAWPFSSVDGSPVTQTELPAFNALATYEVAENGPARMLRSFRLAVDDAIEDELTDIRCPVLLVTGWSDRVAPQR